MSSISILILLIIMSIYYNSDINFFDRIVEICRMLQVMSFTFNPFSENTYIVSNENKECIIFDPGMYSSQEEQILDTYIKTAGLKPIYLINTHCHIDHIFGNTYCSETYQLELQCHSLEKQILAMGKTSAALYGLHYRESIEPTIFLKENESIKLGEDSLKMFLTPGHSPGSLSFYSQKDGFVIAGDVLFSNSIGRSDLPLGNHETLIHSIKEHLLSLPDETVVFSGHGPETTIGYERAHNPFLQ